MPTTINYGFTTIEVDETNTKFNVVGDVLIPDNFPPVLAWAGTQLLFSAAEIPAELRNTVWYAPPAERLFLHAYFTYGGGGLKIVVIQSSGSGYPSKSRIINYNMSNYPFTIASVPPEYLDEPWNRDISGWWIANAFTRLTFRATSALTAFPVLWVGAILVKDNMEAKSDNTYLYLCAIPLDESYSPIQFVFKPPSHLFTAAFSWRHIPVFTTQRGLIFPAYDLLEAQPSGQVTKSGDAGQDTAFCMLEVYPAGGETRATAYFQNLPDYALPVIACHEHHLSGFSTPNDPTRVLSPFEGVYWRYDYTSNSLVAVNYSEHPIALIPNFLTYSFDGALLIGATYGHTYFTVSGGFHRVILLPQFGALFSTVDINSNTIFKYGFLPFTQIADISDLEKLPMEDKYFIPSVDIGVSQRRAVVSLFDKLLFVDVDSNAVQEVAKVKTKSDTVGVGIFSPCEPVFPQNYIQSMPIFSAFYYKSGATRVKPFSAARISHPIFLPNTLKAIITLFVRPAEPGGNDWVGDRGKIFILEQERDAFTPVENIMLSSAGGAYFVVFDAPITQTPVAFVVENPPYPYFYAGPPNANYIIADSVAKPYLFEKDVSGTGSGVWVKMGQTIFRRSAYEPPFRIRVQVFPKHGNYIRVLAYRVSGGGN